MIKRRSAPGLVAGIALAILMTLMPVAQSEAASARVSPAQLAGGGKQWRLLVPMVLPMQLAGGEVTGWTTLRMPGREWSRAWKANVHAGLPRRVERRDSFRFRHGLRISRGLARAIRRHGKRVRVGTRISYRLPTVEPSAERNQKQLVAQRRVKRSGAGVCESLPRVKMLTSTSISRRIGYPVCGRHLRWRLVRPPAKGKYVAKARWLRYERRAGQTGFDEFELAGFFRGRAVTRQKVVVSVAHTDGSGVSVVALGDSVTAGFGYFGATGKSMSISQLLQCRPGATVLNDACSSNSYNRKSSVGNKPDYLPDFGLSGNISWAAKWANEYGITDYANYAVTGSAPSDWLPGGQFNQTLKSIESQNPDYILMTIGANPLLSDVLFGEDNMGCALESDLFGNFRQCVLDAFATVDLDQNLHSLYASLVNNTSSQIVLMGYHLAVPASALAYTSVQLEAMTEILNEVIAAEAAEVSPGRITVVSPPRFDVGIDMEPLYPSNFTCSFFGFQVDGPSVQSSVTQDELLINHPFSFCSGPAIGPPWIISGDTGIHPSAAGYRQMASQVPAPGS